MRTLICASLILLWAAAASGQTDPAATDDADKPAAASEPDEKKPAAATEPDEKKPAAATEPDEGDAAPKKVPDTHVGDTPTPPAPPTEEPPANEPPAKVPDLPKETAPKASTGDKGGFDELPAWEPLPGTAPVDAQDGSDMSTADWDAATAPALRVTFPWIESHGYFRTRADMFHNLDLDTWSRSEKRGTSPVLPPLTELRNDGSGHPEDLEHTYVRGADSLSSVNMRFRYQPTVHVAESLRVKGTFDILDNLVLGSTPDGAVDPRFARPDNPLITFSGSQRPPESGVNGFEDAVRVKQLWGEWKTPVALLMFGRVPSHWGLGVLANNGDCLDCDFGDNVDRIMGVTNLYGTYLAVGWDFPAEGYVGQSSAASVTGLKDPPNNENQPYGQKHDFDQRDDVGQWVIALFQKPLSDKDKAVRTKKLHEDRTPVFDWGVYNVIRNQNFTSEYQIYPAKSAAEVSLADVKAFAYVPDIWLKFQHAPSRNHYYRVELEGVGIFGVIEEIPARKGQPKDNCEDASVANVEDCPDDLLIHPRRRTLTQWGYALEFDHRVNKLQWGLRHGAASGDDSEGFGVLDRTPFDASDPNDQEITNLKFDRDYLVDLILFRELIGSVTNAVYFRPYLSYDLIRDEREAWGFEIAPQYAFAMRRNATPGNESPLGLEFDLQLYVHEFDVFRWGLAYGILFPFGAFDLLDQDDEKRGVRTELRSPGVAQTLQMSVAMQF